MRKPLTLEIRDQTCDGGVDAAEDGDGNATFGEGGEGGDGRGDEDLQH